MQLAEQINKKWAPVLDHPDLPEIKDAHRRAVTAMCLENVESQYAQDQQTGGLLSEAVPVTVMGQTTASPSDGGAAGGTDAGQVNVDFADPVLISMVRRAMPQLIAYDICGVQPMSGPTGLIFALRARTASADASSGAQDKAELLVDEADTTFSGAGTHGGSAPGLLIDGTGTGETGTEYESGDAMTTLAGETDISNEMLSNLKVEIR